MREQSAVKCLIRADRQIIDYYAVVAPTGRHGFAGAKYRQSEKRKAKSGRRKAEGERRKAKGGMA